ncbi:replication initiator protein A [Alkalicoccobacillus gibsonii]|uniref:replication initiator protein A n=1 Tax=Alkalicoccobacillus gibsonii TaxID=79881 RepID=UPI003F7C0042
MSKRFSVHDAKNEEFIQFPRWLISEDKYKGLSNDAKVAFALLKDRFRLSIHTFHEGNDSFVDEEGSIYCVYTLKQLMEILNLSDKTVTKAKKELIKVGLLEEVRRGQGKANRYYILNPVFENDQKKDCETLDTTETRRIYDSKNVNSTSQESENLRGSNKDFSQSDLSNLEEEEYIIRARAKNIAYDILNDFLQHKKLDQKTINKTIKHLIELNLDIFLIDDVEKQLNHMIEKHSNGERIYDFAKYFAKGLLDLTVQSKVSREYQEEKLREYEARKQLVDENPKKFMDWLKA